MPAEIRYVEEIEIPPLIESVLDEVTARAEAASHRGMRVGKKRHPFPTIFVSVQCPEDFEARNYVGVVTGYPITRMFICEALGEQPLRRIRGILYHEMGHILKDVCGLMPPMSSIFAEMFGGQEPLDDEQLTDAVAEHYMNIEIYYDEDMVQQVGRGAGGTRPRPHGLT